MKLPNHPIKILLLGLFFAIGTAHATTYEANRIVSFFLKDSAGNGIGNAATISAESAWQFYVGQSYNAPVGIVRTLRSYALPELSAMEEVASATLTFSIIRTGSNSIGNVNLYHSVTDELTTRNAGSFGDDSYLLAQADIATASQITSQPLLVSVDVTDLIRNDYAYAETIASSAVSSFRFQIDLAFGNNGEGSFESTQSMTYQLTDFKLTLETQQVPEPATWVAITSAGSLLFVLLHNRRRRRA